MVADQIVACTVDESSDSCSQLRRSFSLSTELFSVFETLNNAKLVDKCYFTSFMEQSWQDLKRTIYLQYLSLVLEYRVQKLKTDALVKCIPA